MSRFLPVASMAVAVTVLPAMLGAQAPAAIGRWSANIRPSLSTSSGLGSSTKRMYGSVNIVPDDRGVAGSWRIDVRLTSDRPSESLLWTVSPGQCSSGSIPLKQPTELPPLEVHANENGDVTASVILPLLPEGSYHLDIFRGGQTQESVIACAALKYSKPK